MATLGEVAKYIRSKGAGPFWATIEAFFDDDESYNKVKNSSKISRKLIAETYHVDENSVKMFQMDDLRVIKFSFPRVNIQGHKYERDMHAGQQYVLLTDFEI